MLLISLGFGGCRMLRGIAGRYKAMELILTGRYISATEALQMGIVCKVMNDSESLWRETLRFAKLCSKFDTEAIESSKEAILNYEDLSIQEASMKEKELFSRLYLKKTTIHE